MLPWIRNTNELLYSCFPFSFHLWLYLMSDDSYRKRFKHRIRELVAKNEKLHALLRRLVCVHHLPFCVAYPVELKNWRSNGILNHWRGDGKRKKFVVAGSGGRGMQIHRLASRSYDIRWLVACKGYRALGPFEPGVSTACLRSLH